MSGEKIYEGVFAVHKPRGVTSADVLRHLQKYFNPSETFRPWLEDEIARRQQDSNFQRRRRRKDKKVEVKIGHGGTLDPLATGVLIAGVGKGTKHLQSFLECTKTYETVVLFGAETDTYDRLGKIVRRAPYEHVTRDVVEKALEQFRGKIMQRPPIFSALRVQGKKLYEYAREGKEPPIEIKARPVEVHDLRILEWYEPGTHEYKWPEEEMAGDEKAVAEKMLDKDASVPVASEEEAAVAAESSLKRKSPPPVAAEEDEGQDVVQSAKRLKTTAEGESTQAGTHEPTITTEEGTKEKKQEGAAPDKEPAAAAPPPAVKITMTVSSGFYVRSLAHDLGKAVGSCALMSELVRSRQGDFVLSPDKVLEYEDLERGEEVWGPKVRRFLEEWEEKQQKKAQSKQ
ncbi:hypothetical protein VTN77DRAFT_3759 [Rasamsonia byssochlamydoides]|uniref:uncharacterized protein n=1 Tax=Rasamsonia byssochlamydoides TaxID=89139 RepID=UPI003742485B